MNSVAIAGLTSILVAANVQAQSASDWRFIGGTADALVFYDASGVHKLTDGHFKVWMKSLPLKATSNAVDKLSADKAHVDRMARKLATGYVPPIGFTHSVSQKEILAGVLFEEVADQADIDPIVRMLVEIDCQNSMSRDLSVTINKGGKVGSSERVGEWQHIPPETNIATLHAALCR